MSKIRIKTGDVFNIKSENIRQKYFDYCHKKALKCGIQCIADITEEGFMILKMTGSKTQLVKYYLITLFKTTHKADGIKRLFSIIMT
ncbi:MAG: hypothetical protein Q4G33_13845 [bacterium]|nr:hypothetical protein [bacterium]